MSMQIEIVSAECKIFSGFADLIVASTIFGEVGIKSGHAPLLAMLQPGQVRLIADGNIDEQVFYISGGFLEVQPDVVTVLADTALRASDVDEAAALEAQQHANHILTDKKSDFDYAKARVQLAQSMAQLRALQLLRERSR